MQIQAYLSNFVRLNQSHAEVAHNEPLRLTHQGQDGVAHPSLVHEELRDVELTFDDLVKLLASIQVQPRQSW